MTTDTSAPEPMPAWAQTLNENIAYAIGQIDELKTALRDINAQLQTIGDVDQFGRSRYDDSG